DLVITLAGCAMSHRVSAGLFGDLNEALGDQRTGDGRSQKVGALVKRVGAEHGEHEIADKFLAQIIDIDLADAEHFGLLACRLEFFTLAKIRRESNDFRAKFGLKPLEDNRGVEAAGICQNDLLYVFVLVHSLFQCRGPENEPALRGNYWQEKTQGQALCASRMPRAPLGDT